MLEKIRDFIMSRESALFLCVLYLGVTILNLSLGMLGMAVINLSITTFMLGNYLQQVFTDKWVMTAYILAKEIERLEKKHEIRSHK